jgi:hypothetical protein
MKAKKVRTGGLHREHLSIMYITMGIFVEYEISTMSMVHQIKVGFLKQIITEV